MYKEIVLTVNNEKITTKVKTHWTLLEMLRNNLRLTGAKEGCGLGACGSCTVLLNGIPTRSCIVLTAELDGSEISTIEGLADGSQQQSLQSEMAVYNGRCENQIAQTLPDFIRRSKY